MIKTGASLLHSVLLFFTVMLLSTPLLGRDKTDVIVLKNGDHVTGEIKSLDRGKLSLSTDSMGTVQIEWEDVERVTSQWVFEVETEMGLRSFGSLAPAAEPKMMEIIGEGSRNTLHQTSVVRMTQIEAGVLDRLEGYVDMGFSFARANRATEWTLGSGVNTRGETRQLKFSLSSRFNSRKDLESTTRNVLTFDWTRFFSRRWLVTALTNFTQNQELDLDLRSTFGGGLGRHLIQNNRTRLTVTGGAVFTREKFAPTDTEPMAKEGSNIESMGTVEYDFFTFGDHETDIVTTLTVLPSLSDWGRVRAQLDSRIRYELFKDFFWAITLFDQYDSRPPEGTEKNDFGITTSVGWSF
ncbi:MAG: DUF481 domain-containing protein [Acidobacteria bacterium]|nr:DUF481 domain-containing protein [Acidobacteriota bacterium]